MQITITTRELECNAEDGVLPISYPRFAGMVQKGDTIFLARYLVTGSEESSLYLQVSLVQSHGLSKLVACFPNAAEQTPSDVL